MIFDSISESDPNVSNNSSKTDDSEMQLIAESRGIHLQEMNDNLQKENSKLRAQFDEAVRANNQVQDLHNRIAILSNENMKLRNEKDELNHRLEISLHANNELSLKYEEQKESLHELRKSDLLSLQAEIQKMQNSLRIEKENMIQNADKQEAEKEKMVVEMKTLQNIIFRIKSGAEHYLALTFKTTEDMITFFNQTPLRVQETQGNFNISESMTVKNQQIAELEKQKKKILNKLDNAKAEISSFEEDILRLKKDHFCELKSYSSQIEDLKAQLEHKEEAHQIIDEENKYKNDVLRSKVDALMDELKKAKELEPRKTLITDISSNIAADGTINQKIYDLEDTIEDLTTKNTTTLQKLTETDAKLNNTIKKLKDTENERDSLKNEYDAVFNDYSALKLVHQTADTELQTMRMALRSKEDPKILVSKKDKIKQLKEHINDLEKNLQEKENQNAEQVINFDDKLRQLENDKIAVKSENERLKTKMSELNDQIKALNQEVCKNKIDQQFNSYQYPSQQQSIIPVSSYIPQNMPNCQNNGNNNFRTYYPNQSQDTEKVVKKNRRDPNNNKYRKHIKEAIKINEKLSKEKDEIQKAFNKFVVSVSSLVSSKQTTNFEECLNDLNNTINSNDIVKRENDSLKAIIKHFTDEFSINQSANDSSVMVSQITDLKNKFIKQKTMLQKRKQQISQLQKAVSALNEKLVKQESEIDSKQQTIERLAQNVKDFDSKNSKMKRQIHSQKLQLSNYEKIQEESEISCSKHVDQLINDKKELENSLREQMNDLNQKIADYAKQVDSLKEEISSLKKTNRNQKAQIVDLGLKLENSNNDYNEKEQHLKNAHETEKTNLQKAIADLQNELQSNRSDIEKLAKQLACAQKKLKQAKSCWQEAKLEKDKLEKEIEAQKEQLQREKQLSETNAKAQILKAESEYTAKLDEQRGRWEKEKRKYFAFVADQFRQFFNPQDAIDERSFRDVVSRAKDELVRLNSSDNSIRKLVGAESRQKTEDAVAQIVMNN